VLALRGGVHKTRIPTPTMAAVDSVDDEDMEQEGEEDEEEFKSDPDLDAPELDATEDDLVSEASLRPDLSACIKRCTHMTSSKLRRTSQMPQPVPVRCCVPRPPKSLSSQPFNLHAKVLIHARIVHRASSIFLSFFIFPKNFALGKRCTPCELHHSKNVRILPCNNLPKQVISIDGRKWRSKKRPTRHKRFEDSDVQCFGTRPGADARLLIFPCLGS
jgi:hypothetical protein